jgi:hypothetical protein
VLGKQPYELIAQRLHEVGDHEAAQYFEAKADHRDVLEEGLFSFNRWLDTNYQYGFVGPFAPNSKKPHKISSATNMQAEASLQNQRIDVRLDWLHAYDYPRPMLDFGDNIHSILFTFEARNQLKKGTEHVAFNQVYHVRSGQSAPVTGHPIFTGINVGSNGIEFSCKTVNVSNSNDKRLVEAISSPAMKLGLNLLTTAQPALAPFVGVATGLAKSLSKKNIGVHDFTLGLDFETGASGARIAVGSYVVVQVPYPNELSWSDWGYDADSGVVVRTNLAEEEEPYVLPYNALIFRVSKYRG